MRENVDRLWSANNYFSDQFVHRIASKTLYIAIDVLACS
jgi:hypothetical protein